MSDDPDRHLVWRRNDDGCRRRILREWLAWRDRRPVRRLSDDASLWIFLRPAVQEAQITDGR